MPGAPLQRPGSGITAPDRLNEAILALLHPHHEAIRRTPPTLTKATDTVIGTKRSHTDPGGNTNELTKHVVVAYVHLMQRRLSVSRPQRTRVHPVTKRTKQAALNIYRQEVKSSKQ